MALAEAVYELSKSFPREELYGLTGQLRRSALSIPSHIAEGSSSNSLGEFKQFPGVARGWTYEVRTQVESARNLKFVSPEKVQGVWGLAHEAGRMLYALLESL
jgi:four helix bundle protein